MATKKLTKPQEVCPVCGERFTSACDFFYRTYYTCANETHAITGPNDDPYGRGIDRMVRTIRRRMAKETRA